MVLLLPLALIAGATRSTVSIGWHGELEAASLLGLNAAGLPEHGAEPLPEAATPEPPAHGRPAFDLTDTQASWKAPRIAKDEPAAPASSLAEAAKKQPEAPAQLRARAGASPDDPRKYVVSVLLSVPVFLLARHLLHLVVVDGLGARTAATALAAADAPQVDTWARLVGNAPIALRFLSAVGMLAVLVLDFAWERNRHMYLLEENRLTLVLLCLYLLVGLFTTIHLRGARPRSPLAEKRALLTANSEMIALVYPLSLVAAVLFWLYEWRYVPSADRPGLGFTLCPHGLNALVALSDAFAIGQPLFLGDMVLPVAATLAYVFQTLTYYHWLEGQADLAAMHKALAWGDRPDEAAMITGAVAFLVLPESFALFYGIAQLRAPAALYSAKESAAPPRAAASAGPAGGPEDSSGSDRPRRKPTIRWEDRN